MVCRQALQQMDTYSEEARHQFEHCLGWLNQWACSRSFGLGTRVPWDPQYLVESLSDSTIYMAYYTVAHFLQEGNLYGEGSSQIRAEDVTDKVFLPCNLLLLALLVLHLGLVLTLHHTDWSKPWCSAILCCDRGNLPVFAFLVKFAQPAGCYLLRPTCTIDCSQPDVAGSD